MGLYSYRGLTLNVRRNNFFKINLSLDYDWLSVSDRQEEGEHSISQNGKLARRSYAQEYSLSSYYEGLQCGTKEQCMICATLVFMAVFNTAAITVDMVYLQSWNLFRVCMLCRIHTSFDTVTEVTKCSSTYSILASPATRRARHSKLPTFAAL